MRHEPDALRFPAPATGLTPGRTTFMHIKDDTK